MNRGDAREARIVCVHGSRHCREARHEAIQNLVAPNTPQQTLKFVAVAHRIAGAAPFNQRRAAENQAVARAGKAEIVVAIKRHSLCIIASM
jgi:hypothetical protein